MTASQMTFTKSSTTKYTACSLQRLKAPLRQPIGQPGDLSDISAPRQLG